MMPTGSPTVLPDEEAPRARVLSRPPLRLHRGSAGEATDTATAREVAAEAWPLHSMDTLAATLVVAGAAAGWMVALAMTGPVLLAGGWLGRVARETERA